MKNRTLIIIILAVIAGFSCSSDGKNTKSKKESTSHLPVARGTANVILVVMDTGQWNGAIGQTLKDIFSGSVHGLPQDESYFKLRNINPLKFKSVLKSAKNILFVSTINSGTRQSKQMRSYFTNVSLDKISKDTSLYKLTQKDKFARGQELVHLFGQTETQLVDHLEKNKSLLRNHFINVERKRLRATLFKVREKQIEKNVLSKHQFSIKIPYGYDLAKSLDGFVWFRKLNPEFETNVFVHYRPFDSEEPFKNVMALREEITSTNMRDIQKPDIFMTIQGEQYNYEREINFKGNYAKETRGLWKLSDISGGGPFVSYLFVDQDQRRMYYLEGYVYAPSKDKYTYVQEVETIINSFKTTPK